MGINFVKDKFEDADAIIEAFQNGELESYARPNSVSNASVNENFENNMEIINAEEEKSFSAESQYYRLFGDVNESTRYFTVLKEFKDRIMSTVIFDKKTKSPIVAEERMPNGHTLLNTQLALYKMELVLELADAIGYQVDPMFKSISKNDLSAIEDDLSFNYLIQSVLFAFDNHPNKLKFNGKVKDLYFKLSEFNRILRSEFDWIVLSEDLVDSSMHSINMYERHDPKGKHRRNFNSDDAMQASIDKYTSNYMRRILDFIPEASEEVDSNGEFKDIDGTHIGFTEFCHAISTVYDWALNDSNVESEIKKEALKGNRGDVGKVIKAYLDAMPKTYRTSHMAKLRGLYKYLFSPDTYVETKNLFVNQIEKTIKTDWMVYVSEYDPETKSYRFTYKTLTSILIDARKQDIASAIRSTVYLHRNNFDEFAKTFQNRIEVEGDTIRIYGVRSDGNGYIEIIRDSNNLDYVDWNSSEYTHIDNKKAIQFIFDLLGLNVKPESEEKLKEIMSQFSERNVFELFSKAIAHTIRGIHDGRYIKYEDGIAQIVTEGTAGATYVPSVYTFERGDKWSINLKNYLRDFDNAAVYLSRLFGAEQYNVLKDLHGNNVPYFQLGSYMHDIKKIAASIGEVTRSPYFKNTFVSNPAALGRTLLRNDVANGSAVMKAKEESATDIMYLAMTQDLYAHLISPNDNGTILVQPTCNADKSKFDLREVNLRKIKLGGDLTAFDCFHLIATSTDSSISSFGTPIINSRRRNYIESIENEILKYRRSKTKRLFLDAYNRLRNILNIDSHEAIINENSTILQVNRALEILNAELRDPSKNWTIEKIEKLANRKGISFYPESDLSVGIEGLQINDVLENYKEMYWETGNDPEHPHSEHSIKSRQRWNYNKLQFVKKLRQRRFSLNLHRDGSLKLAAAKMFGGEHSVLYNQWVNSITGEIKTHLIKDKKTGNVIKVKENELYKYDNSSEYEVELNPLLEAFFYSQAWFAQQLTDILYGDVALAASKTSYDNVKKSTIANVLLNDGFTELRQKLLMFNKGQGSPLEFYMSLTDETEKAIFVKAFKEAQARESEASRTATAFKRNMIGGSTRHNPMPQQFGLAEEMIVANMDDFDTPISDFFGKLSMEHAIDGAGFCSPVKTILENWSYMESSLGKSRKTIWGYMDPETGHFHEIKWATFTITNETRLNSMVNNDFSFEIAFEKMHGFGIGDKAKDIDLTRFWSQDSISYSQHVGWHRKKLTIDDDIFTQKDGKYYQLISIEKVENEFGYEEWQSNWEGVTIENGEPEFTGETYSIKRVLNTLYDVDQLFGGAFISEWDEKSGNFVTSEINNIILANIVCEHDLKDRFIGDYLPHQTMKMSVKNRNANEVFSQGNTENLYTYKIKFTYGGAQMDAEHEVEDGDVAEMMQTIAALVQNGYMMEEAFDIYDLIGQTVRESIPEFRKAIDKNDTKKLDFLLGKMLIDSFAKESGDKLGLAGAFVRRAEQVIRSNSKKDIEIPFSANSIKGKFIAEVASKVNKAIKRRCPGLGTVQAPSYKIMSHFIHNGQVVSYRKLTEILSQETIKVGEIDYPLMSYVQDLYESGVLDEDSYRNFNYRDVAKNLFSNQLVDKEGVIRNPFIESLGEIGKKQLQIEDTVVVRPKGSKEAGKVIQLKDLRELDFFQNIIDLNNFEVYVWKNQSRELRSAITEVELDVPVSEGGVVKSNIALSDLDVNRALFYIYEYSDDAKEQNLRQFKYSEVLGGAYQDLAINFEIADWAKKLAVIKKVINDNDELAAFRFKTNPDGSTTPFTDSELIEKFDEMIPILKQISQKINILISEVKRGKSDSTLPIQLSMLSDSLSDTIVIDPGHRIKNVQTKLPQIIMGRAYLSLLGIRKGDNVWDITGPEYFEERLKEADSLPSIADVPTYGYDCMMTLEDGRNVLVKIGDHEIDEFINQDAVKVGNKHFSNRMGTLMYGTEEVCDSENISVFTYYTPTGNDYDLIVVKSEEEFKNLLDSGYFNYAQYNYTTENYQTLLSIQDFDETHELQRYKNVRFGFARTEKILLSDILQTSPEAIVDALREDNDIQVKQRRRKLAEQRWIAYKETLRFIGARIPTQSMQSFSGAEIVMFADIDTNECWLPRVVTWIEGSDYDIDKWYLWGLGLNKNGTIATLSDTADELGVRNSFRLGLATGGKFVTFDPTTQSINRIEHDDTIEFRTIDSKTNEEVKVFYDKENKSIKLDNNYSEETIKAILMSIPDSEFTIEGLKKPEFVRQFGFSIIAENTIKRVTIPILTSDDIPIISKDDSESDKELKREQLARSLAKVTKSGVTTLNFENCSNAQQKLVLRLLNKHAKSKRNGKTKELALKNATFYGIQEIVSDPINQINLHMPIAMDAPKKAAKKSPLAAEESVMCLDDPSTIFIMQEANMSGKNVVGIGATSLKGFFNSTAYYNMQVVEMKRLLQNYMYASEEDKKRIGQEVYNILNRICFDSKFKTEELRSLANIYWEPVLQFIKDYEITTLEVDPVENKICTKLNSVFVENGQLNLLSVVEHLNRTSKYNNCADDISAVISAATDNAKELILSKLNATEQFADIYTYLLTTGEKFSDIAEFMTSPIMSIIQKFAKKSFLVPSSGFTKVKDVINFVLDEGTINPIPKMTFESVLLSFLQQPDQATYISDIKQDDNDGKIKRGYALLHNDEFVDKFKNYLTALHINASEYVVEVFRDPDSIDPSDMEDIEIEGGGSISNSWDVSSLTKTDIEAIFDYVENTLIPKNEMLLNFETGELEVSFRKLRHLRDVIIPGCEEQQKLGGLLSLNKGLKTDDFEEYSFIMNFQTWINQKCVDKKLNEDPFDFLRFASDTKYQKHWIDVYEKIKVNKNILAIIVNTSHFKEMLALLKVNRYLLERAAVVRLERKIADEIVKRATSKSFKGSGSIKYGDTQKLSAKEFQILKNMTAEIIPFVWLTNSQISFYINEGDSEYAWDYSSKTPRTVKNAHAVTFDSPDAMATFKRLMDVKLIPALRKLYPDNKFLINLKKHAYSDSNSDLPVFSWVPIINMSDSDLTTDLLYNDMLAGFDEIANHRVGDKLGIYEDGVTDLNFTVGDLFFLYDLIINKGQVRKTGFVRFFENQIKLGRRHSLNDQYHKFIVDLDKGNVSIDSVVFEGPKLFENYFFNLGNLEYLHRKYRIKFDKRFTGVGANRTVEKTIMWPSVSFGLKSGSSTITLTSIGGDYTFKTLPRTIKTKYEPTIKGLRSQNNDQTTHVIGSAELLSEVANYFDSHFGTKVPFRIVNESEIRELCKSGEIKVATEQDIERHVYAKGFINNGVVYINSGAEGVGVDTMFHELLHIVCAAMKFHKSYQKMYYKLLDDMKLLPNYQQVYDSVMEKYTYTISENGQEKKQYLVTGSDLKEEILVELLSNKYKTIFENEWNAEGEIDLQQIQDAVLSIAESIFKVEGLKSIDPAELGATPIGTMLKVFNSRLLNPGNSLFAKTRIPMGQKLSKIKQELINKGIIKYGEECY